MGDWDDFDYREPYERKPDEYVISREKIERFFEEYDSAVFFGNQLAVRNEDEFFHWVTYRAIKELVEKGVIRTETQKLAIGSDIKLLWHRRQRNYKRDAKSVIALVNEYGSPNICGAIGLHGEQMILGGFARKQFVMRGHNTRIFQERQWTKT